MKKALSLFIVLSLILTNMSIVYATNKNGYDTNTLFNFGGKTNDKKENTESKSEKEKTTSPLSDVLDIDTSKMKRVIVKTHKVLTEKEQKQIINDLGSFNRKLESVIGFSAYIPEDNISLLEKNSLVKQVYLDNVVSALSTDNNINYDSISLYQSLSQKTLNTSGIGVAVLDTGIYPHNDLKDRIVAFKDFVNNKDYAYDDNGHGTNVTGIIGANGIYAGVSSNLDLIGVKVLDSNEQGYMSNVVSGIDWVIQNKDKYNIRIINLSLGMQSNTRDPLVEAVERAWNEGIVVVVAAGNTGYNGNITSPATSPSVISVGSSDTNGTNNPMDDTLSWFSVGNQYVNGIKKPEIFAPGNNIITTSSPNGKKMINYPSNVIDGTYYKTSGTSMSAPIVSGIVSMIIADNPSLNPNQIKNKIIENTIHVNDMDIINIAKIFGIVPQWEDKIIEKPIIQEDVQPIEIIPAEQIPIEIPMENKENIDDIIFSTNNNNYIVTENKYKHNIEDIEIDEKYHDKIVNSMDDTTVKSDKVLLDKEVDTPGMEKVSDGKDFVYEVYDNKTVLSNILNSKYEYLNQTEVIEKNKKIEDIIYLFNYINRAFTSSDFDYFKNRLIK